MVKLADFREILHYIPQFRDQIFVLSLDHEVVACDNFRNLLLDMALLRSVNIDLALVLNFSNDCDGLQASPSARSHGSPAHPTDEAALEEFLTTGNRQLYQIMSGLQEVGLQAAVTNTVTSRPAGVLDGIDLQYSGRVQEIDVTPLRRMLKTGIIPVVPPFASDGDQTDYRLDGDALAMELALSLSAMKIIYLTDVDGVVLEGSLRRQLTTSALPALLAQTKDQLVPGLVAKLEYATAAVKRGIERVHIINGLTDEGLLAELFSNEGVGTLVYDDEYEVIRRATAEDVPAVLTLLQQAAVNDEVRQPTRESVAQSLEHLFVYEIDHTPVACAALYPYPRNRKGELGSLAVSQAHHSQGIGKRLIQHIEQLARSMGYTDLLCLSTQAYSYFRQKAGFREGTPEDLPPSRRREWLLNGRNSKILIKSLADSE